MTSYTITGYRIPHPIVVDDTIKRDRAGRFATARTRNARKAFKLSRAHQAVLDRFMGELVLVLITIVLPWTIGYAITTANPFRPTPAEEAKAVQTLPQACHYAHMHPHTIKNADALLVACTN